MNHGRAAGHEHRDGAEPLPAVAAEGQRSLETWALGLASAYGNGAFARAVSRLQRQHVDPPPTPTPAPTPGGTDGQPQPGMSGDAAKKLVYAQTVLSKIDKLPEGDKAALEKAASGSSLLALIERRDKLAKDLEQAKIDLESTKDISGPEKPLKESEAKERVDKLSLDLEGIQIQIADGLKTLGISDEKELVQLVNERFPQIWKDRAKQIVNRMLDENLRAVEAEEARYDYLYRTNTKGFDDSSALRRADTELHEKATEIQGRDGSYVRTFEALKDNIDRGMRKGPYELSGDEEASLARSEALAPKMKLKARWEELGMQHVLLFHPMYETGKLSESGDEDLIKLTGEYTKKTRENIDKTRKNVGDEKLSLWKLRDVPDMTFQSLGITRDSILGKAVEKHFADTEADEEALKMALESLAITATIFATMFAGPVGLAVGALAQGAVGVYGLSQDMAKLSATSAAGGVALDPELAKLSTEEPDHFELITDIVGLGMSLVDARAAAKGLIAALREFKATRDASKFITQAEKVLGDATKAEILAGKVKVGERKFPERFMEVFDDYQAAHKSYMEALKADPMKEVGIWRNRKTGKFVVGYGEAAKVEGPALWDLVKHHHPGSPIAATMGDRLPSGTDFGNLMAPQIADIEPRPAKSMITWLDEEGRMHYTTFGHDPTKVDRYWVRYVGPDGSIQTKTFVHDPWHGQGKQAYDSWFEQVAHAELLSPPTVR